MTKIIPFFVIILLSSAPCFAQGKAKTLYSGLGIFMPEMSTGYESDGDQASIYPNLEVRSSFSFSPLWGLNPFISYGLWPRESNDASYSKHYGAIYSPFFFDFSGISALKSIKKYLYALTLSSGPGILMLTIYGAGGEGGRDNGPQPDDASLIIFPSWQLGLGANIFNFLVSMDFFLTESLNSNRNASHFLFSVSAGLL